MIFESTGTVLAVYCSAQPVLLCKCVKKVHEYNSFPIKFADLGGMVTISKVRNDLR